MYCASCGKTVDLNSKFCSNCGAAISSAVPPPPSGIPMGGYPATRLFRPQYPRMIAGVCSGFALAYGWDVTLVRVLVAVGACLSGGIILLAYFIAWVAMPEAPYTLPNSTGNSTGNPIV